MANSQEIQAYLHRDLQDARDGVLWKLEGLSEYDVRRPLVSTGTNLLGVVKHLATMEAGYFGDTFGRHFEEALPWFTEDAEANSDLWATPRESREYLTGLYRRLWKHSDATVAELGLDGVGHVPWWSEDNQVTVQRILVYMIAETNRHAGHADLVRELIDGKAGWREGDECLPPGDRAWWESYRERLERAAREASGQG